VASKHITEAKGMKKRGNPDLQKSGGIPVYIRMQ